MLSEQKIISPTPIKRFMNVFDLSESAADTLYSVANIAVLLASIVGVAGAICLFWASGFRDKFASIRELGTQLRITELQSLASQADERAADANAVAAQANENTARLEKEAVILRQNHEALKQQVEPRDISNAMRLKFLELTKDAPKGRIRITYVTDGEAKFFALKIGALLNEAGYDAPKSLGEMGSFTGVSPSGVYFKSGDAKDVVGILLQRAFLEIGIESGASVSEYQSGLEIFIGSRQ